MVVCTARRFLVRIPSGACLCGVCMFSPCMSRFTPDTPASSHLPKKCMSGSFVTPDSSKEWLWEWMVVCLICLYVSLWWTGGACTLDRSPNDHKMKKTAFLKTQQSRNHTISQKYDISWNTSIEEGKPTVHRYVNTDIFLFWNLLCPLFSEMYFSSIFMFYIIVLMFL